MDETATGFIDIQFGLIAILILLLSAAMSGIGNLSNQLKGVEGGMAGVIDLLLCNWNGDQGDCESEDRNRFAGHGQSEIGLIRPGQELVLVLGMTSLGGGDGLFTTNRHAFPVPEDVRREAMTTIRDRINRVLPCFAPFSRTTPDLRARAGQSLQDCMEVLGRFSGGAAPGIDLLQIEGHGDRDRILPTGEPLVALNRAQAVLLSLLVEPGNGETAVELIRRINRLDTADRLARQLDGIMDRSSSVSLGDLFWLAPLGARIAEECRLGRAILDAGIVENLPDWCQELLREEPPNASGASESQLPKLFAMTSYGRYSLRYGSPDGPVDPRDRRVEFRLRGSIIPTAIHNLFEQTGNDGVFRLYSTDAVLALHKCDATRESNQTCLDALDPLTRTD